MDEIQKGATADESIWKKPTQESDVERVRLVNKAIVSRKHIEQQLYEAAVSKKMDFDDPRGKAIIALSNEAMRNNPRGDIERTRNLVESLEKISVALGQETIDFIEIDGILASFLSEQYKNLVETIDYRIGEAATGRAVLVEDASKKHPEIAEKFGAAGQTFDEMQEHFRRAISEKVSTFLEKSDMEGIMKEEPGVRVPLLVKETNDLYGTLLPISPQFNSSVFGYRESKS